MKYCKYCFAQLNSDTEFCTECGFNGHLKDNKGTLEIGTRLKDRYVLGGVFSQGGGFISYYAHDTITEKSVKITEFFPKLLILRQGTKIISRSSENKEKYEAAVLKLHNIFEKLKQISSDSILDISDCFSENSVFYYVVPTEKRLPLSSKVGNGRKLGLSETLALLGPLTDCLEKMHAASTFHGCVNPYNVLCDENGKIVSLTGYTYPPKATATPFDAPEKKHGAVECGARTDIYSLGAMVYEAVTGTLPISADEREKGRALVFSKDFDPKIRAVIEKAMSLKPSERYGNISEFIADFAKKDVPAKKISKKKKDAGRKILTAFAAVCFIVSLGFLLNYYVIDPYFAAKRNDDIVSLIESTTQPTVDPWIAIREKYPDTGFPQNMNPAFADLYAANNDFAGWVSIPGLDINTAVVQADDNDKYLRRDFYGNTTSYGAPFFDFRNAMMTLDRNTVIYGHNMRHDDKIFGTLEKYRDPETFRQNPIIKMSTLYGDYTFKIYAVFISNSKTRDDNGKIFNYIFTDATMDKFSTYIAEIDKRKLYTTGVEISQHDKILTLSTCCYDFEDARLVVVGRLLRQGESETVDTSKVVINENPKFPQAYYDAKGQENPYKNDPLLFE